MHVLQFFRIDDSAVNSSTGRAAHQTKPTGDFFTRGLVMVKFKAWLKQPIRPPSSWVYAYGYCLVEGKRKPGLAVQYKKGIRVKGKVKRDRGGTPNFSAWYPNTDIGDFETMLRAKSKGKAVHRFWYTLDYEELTF